MQELLRKQGCVYLREMVDLENLLVAKIITCFQKGLFSPAFL